MCDHLLLEFQNYNSLLNNLDSRMLDPTKKKKIPHIQRQRRSSSKMVGGAKLHLESNPIPIRDAQRAQTHRAYQDPETPQRLTQNCV